MRTKRITSHRMFAAGAKMHRPRINLLTFIACMPIVLVQVRAFMPLHPSSVPTLRSRTVLPGAPGATLVAQVGMQLHTFSRDIQCPGLSLRCQSQAKRCNVARMLASIHPNTDGGFLSRGQSTTVMMASGSDSDSPGDLTAESDSQTKIVLGSRDGEVEEDSDQLFLSGTAFEFALAVVALLLGKFLDMSALGPGFDVCPAAIATGFLWTLVPLAFVYSIKLLDLKELKEIGEITEDFAKRLFAGRSNFALALFCFGAGFGEELLFRGIFHQKLELLLGFYPAAAAVGLGFGLAHNLTPAYFVISGLSSFIFSFMFASSGSNIVIPIVAHATYDFVALKITLRDMQKKEDAARE